MLITCQIIATERPMDTATTRPGSRSLCTNPDKRETHVLCKPGCPQVPQVFDMHGFGRRAHKLGQNFFSLHDDEFLVTP